MLEAWGLPAPHLVQPSGEGLWGQVQGLTLVSTLSAFLSLSLALSLCPFSCLCLSLSPTLSWFGFQGFQI